MQQWIEDPFRSIIGGTLIVLVTFGSLLTGMAVIQALV